MKIALDIPEYDPNYGLQIIWEEGFHIHLETDSDGVVVLSANKEGLVTLAKQLLTLANPLVPIGSHIHLDSFGGLEEGSKEFILNKQ